MPVFFILYEILWIFLKKSSIHGPHEYVIIYIKQPVREPVQWEKEEYAL